MEMYIPAQYVCQKELEDFDGVSSGKYVLGLGQEKMSVVDEYEDINSMCLSVLSRLISRHGEIAEKQYARLEVGTETVIDKSKSVKSWLMSLFKHNHDIEGVQTINACYGGTAALFNTLAYMQSDQYYSHQYCLLIMADIALYPPGVARPTGGAGALAFLLGSTQHQSNCIQIDSLRASYFQHIYDFYKPDPTNAYPLVDGQLSINSYINSLDQCYYNLNAKMQTKFNKSLNLADFDFIIFHTPYAKMVQKAYYRLFYLDFIANSNQSDIVNQLKANLYNHENTQKLIQKLAHPSFIIKTLPSLYLSKNMGNIYTAALYGCIISLLTDPQINLANKKILAFSYGSGSAATLFSMSVGQNIDNMKSKLNCRQQIQNRQKIHPQQYSQIMQNLEDNYTKTNQISINTSKMVLFENSYYLSSIDNLFRRKYLYYSTNNANERINSISQQLKKQ